MNVGHGRKQLGEAARAQMGAGAFSSAYAGGTNRAGDRTGGRWLSRISSTCVEEGSLASCCGPSPSAFREEGLSAASQPTLGSCATISGQVNTNRLEEHHEWQRQLERSNGKLTRASGSSRLLTERSTSSISPVASGSDSMICGKDNGYPSPSAKVPRARGLKTYAQSEANTHRARLGRPAYSRLRGEGTRAESVVVPSKSKSKCIPEPWVLQLRLCR